MASKFPKRHFNNNTFSDDKPVGATKCVRSFLRLQGLLKSINKFDLN